MPYVKGKRTVEEALAEVREGDVLLVIKTEEGGLHYRPMTLAEGMERVNRMQDLNLASVDLYLKLKTT